MGFDTCGGYLVGTGVPVLDEIKVPVPQMIDVLLTISVAGWHQNIGKDLPSKYSDDSPFGNASGV